MPLAFTQEDFLVRLILISQSFIYFLQAGAAIEEILNEGKNF